MDSDSPKDLKYQKLTNGEALAYREYGQGDRTLLLLHGNASCSLAFKNLVPTLENSYRIIAPDLRGYGHSTYNTPIQSMYDLCDDIKDFLDKLGLKKVIPIGWSSGAVSATNLASNYPEYVDGNVILFSPVPVKGYQVYYLDENNKPTDKKIATYEDFQKNIRIAYGKKLFEDKNVEGLKAVYERAVHTGPTKATNDFILPILKEAILQRHYADILWHQTQWNITDEHNGLVEGNKQLFKVKAKILVIIGEKDLIIPPNEMRQIKEKLGEQVTLVSFPDSGHAPLDDYPEECLKSIIDFLK